MTATWWVKPCLWDDEESHDGWLEVPEPAERGVEDVPIVIGELL
ncbi:hypothetical protein ACFY97_18515 [Streptomyces klenkii]